jgi:hypothetical protein
VLPGLPSNEKNSSDHHKSYNKGPNLACNGLFESPFKSPSTEKVSKNPPTNWNHSSVPRPPKFHIWSHGPLGVNNQLRNEHSLCALAPFPLNAHL